MTLSNKSAENSAPIKLRVIQFIDHKGIMKKDFFTSIGVSSGSFRGKSLQSEISGSTIAEILTVYPEINPSWLINGFGSMLIGENNKVNEPRPSYGGMQIPFISKYSMSEYLTQMGKTDFWNKMPVVHWEKSTEYSNFSDSKFLTFEMVGSSMNDGSYKSLIDADLLLSLEIERDDWKITEQWSKWNYVVISNQNVAVVKLSEQSKPTHLICSSLNEFHPDFEVPITEVIKIFRIVQIKRQPRF